MTRSDSRARGFSFIEVLAVLLVVGLLWAMALPRYFKIRGDVLKAREEAMTIADLATVRAINSTVALFQLRNQGACPGQGDQPTFAAFLADRVYFPDGPAKDPRTGTPTPYERTYSSSRCRVGAVGGEVNHKTGGGH